MSEYSKSDSGDIIVTCVSEGNEFAQEVLRYLTAALTDEKVFGGSGFRMTPDMFSLQEQEIQISADSGVPKDAVKYVLERFLKSDQERFKGFTLIEFGDTFTVGRQLGVDASVGLETCEICGYFTPYAEELYTHRMTHLGGF